MTEDGDLESNDYIRIRLVEDGTESASVLAEIVDDSATPFPAFETVDVTQANTADDVQVRVEALNNASGEYHSFDDVVVSMWGKEGCTDAAADNYDATAQVDDLSCLYSFAESYSLYDGGFGDPIWRGTACSGGCGSGPFFDAKSISALTQTSSTTFDYEISSGTTVTVDGIIAVDGDPTLEDLFVNDLTIRSGGSLVIPAGKRLRVMGTFTDLDGDAISGGGCLCVDGEFVIGAGGPDVVNVQDFMVLSGSSLDIGPTKTLAVKGDLSFGSTDPQLITGLIDMAGTGAQTITGDGATFDLLRISNTVGVTANDSIEVQGRLTISDSGVLAMGANPLVFASNPATGGDEEEKTGVLDMIPSNATFSGPLGEQSQNAAPTVQVERYFASDLDGVTFSGYSLFASPIEGLTVGDLDDIDGFYLAGWPGTNWPSSFSTVLFWSESTSEFVEPTSNATALDQYGGAWIALAGSQTPTMVTQRHLEQPRPGQQQDLHAHALQHGEHGGRFRRMELGVQSVPSPHRLGSDHRFGRQCGHHRGPVCHL